MVNWYLKRAIQAFATFFVVLNITFFLTRFMPGGPMDYVRAQLELSGIPADRVDRIAEVYVNLHPEDPLWVQYYDYMAAILTGDLGQSMWYQRSVDAIILEALPWTILVMGTSIVLMYSLAIVIGALLAYLEGTTYDQYSSVVLTFLDSIPYYLIALFFLFAFAFQMDFFPTTGRYPRGTEPGFNTAFLWGVFHHAFLPIVSVVITSTGLLTLQMRANSISVLGKDYVRVAQLRGIETRKVANQYVARNAVLPMYTSFMIDIGFMFSGSVILETIFNYPGVGFYLIKSIDTRDQPLMMGTFIVISAAVIIALIVADLTYTYIDPRIKRGGTDESF